MIISFPLFISLLFCLTYYTPLFFRKQVYFFKNSADILFLYYIYKSLVKFIQICYNIIGDYNMKVSAVICEYNPFHNGHKYQLDEAKRLTGCDAVVALMSGSFVQRGEFAVYPKSIRTDAALLNGADLVLENIPLSVLRSAEGYASASVFTLSSLGCADYLIFGAECENLSVLQKIAGFFASESAEYKTALANELSLGASFASARSKAASLLLGNDVSEVLKAPNNLLAIEYLKAIIRQNSRLQPVLIPRRGAEHDSNTTSGKFASASLIRKELQKGSSTAFKYVPSDAATLCKNTNPFVQNAADTAIVSSLCLMSADKLAAAPGISEGLENKIKTEAMRCNTLDEIIAAVKSKRYAYSRIRRAILCAYLGITQNDVSQMPKYIKILGFNKTGQHVLNAAKKTASLPVAKSASPILKDSAAMNNWLRCLEFDRIYDIMHSRL